MNSSPFAEVESQALGQFAQVMNQARPPGHDSGPSKFTIDPNNVKNGLGKLVLTVVELLRNLLERQAIRRIDAGSLTDAEVERLGVTFMRLAEQMERLKEMFDLKDEDLNIDLGPLGKLL
jgi:hypothetical protein